jgi:hypothetical protein
MLPRFHLVIAAIAAVFIAAAALSLLSASRSVSLFAVGPRAATGSPATGSQIEYSLPDPPNWKQSVALAASRRAEELNRLLDLVGTVPEAQAPQALPDAVNDSTGSIARRQDRGAASDTAPTAPVAIEEE